MSRIVGADLETEVAAALKINPRFGGAYRVAADSRPHRITGSKKRWR